MRIRPLLLVTALLSSLLGAVAAYLVLTVPNDLQANVLMKQARRDIANGNYEQARQSLTRVIQQYPRTDAAAGATVALCTLETQERMKLVARIDALQRANESQSKDLQSLGVKVQKAAAAPPPPPPAPVAVATAPPAPAKKPAHATKTTHRAKRRTHHR
jgi:thioredoxin-like negative regulator of GroEL